MNRTIHNFQFTNKSSSAIVNLVAIEFEKGRVFELKLKIHYAWIILVLTFVTLLAAQGVRLSFGAFIEPWETDFSTNRGVITLISFISYIVFAFTQPYVGKLIDRFGVRPIISLSILLIGFATISTFFATSPWQLIVIYGVIASIGFGGASNVAGAIIIANWFKEKKGFVLGLMSVGTAAGQLFLVPAALLLIHQLGWRSTVLVLGFFLTVIVFPLIFLFLRTHPREKNLQAYGESNEGRHEKNNQPSKVEFTQSLSIFQLPKRKDFMYLAFPFFVCGVTTTGLMDTHLIPFAQFCGISPTVTGAAVSLLASFNILRTASSGYLADRWSCRHMLFGLYGVRLLTIILLLVILSDLSLIGIFIAQSHLLLIFAISFGIVNFATVAPTIKLATDYFQCASVSLVGCFSAINSGRL
jgi:MFS family permease